MTNLMIRIATLAAFLMVLNAPASFTPAFGAGGGGGGGGGGGDTSSDPTVQRSTWPQQPSGTKATHVPKAKKAKQSLFDDPAFAKGYREAYATIYDRNEYAAAIEQLRALDHDDHPNVANGSGPR